MSKTLIDTELLEKVSSIVRLISLEAALDGSHEAAVEAAIMADKMDKAVKQSIGYRIFTKEEVEALEKHFDLEAFFEE